jgi:ParB-like chromosome segregation protein Spo0J
MEVKLKTPFKDLLPPLTTVERETLKADIKKNGVLVPVVIDEEGNILDGHNRYAIKKDAPTITINGLSDDEKQAFVIRANFNRRNLSPTQKSEILAKQKALAKSFREADAKKWTQKRVAELLGVSQQSVAKWFSSNTTSSKATKPTPDARVKVNTAAKKAIAKRVKAGESQAQVAADFGVSQKTVSNVVKKESETHSRDDDKKRKTAHLKKSLFDVRKGDFRNVLADLSGVSLVLTDPPYPKESLELWADLAEWASSALLPDGILIAYSGQMYLPQVLANLSRHLEYWWCGAITHKGSGNLTPLGQPVRKVINQWKPLVMFTRKDGVGYPDTFRDLVSGVGPQKDDHNWQQPVEEARAIIQAFTEKGDLVVDPFAGSGGFCKAASEEGRKAIGAEIL